MRIKKRILRKIISVFATVLLLLNSFTPYLLITPIVRSVSAQVEITPTSANEASAEEVPTVIPTTEPTTEPTVEVTPVETIAPTEIPTLAPIEAPSVPSPPEEKVEQTSTALPTITPTPTEATPLLSKEGTVITDIIESYVCRADSLNGCLATDKADYSPTDVALITGHGFLATTTYTIRISSQDEPTVIYEKEISTNEQGGFAFSYQLDGNYRPNYLVELRDGSGQVVASVTFTDTAPVNIPPSFDAIADQNIDEDSPSQDISITNVSPGTGETGQTVTMSATSSDPSIVPNPTVSGSGATRTLTYAPVADANGTVTITVIANDGQTANNIFSRTFSITIAVDNTGPVITIAPYNTSWTNSDITVNATTNEGTLNFVSHTFSSNGSFDFIATDSAGNSTTETVTVTNIDKELPSAPVVTTPSSNGYINSSTTQKFIWTASTDPIPGSGLATTNTYQYQIDDNSDFSSTLRNVSQTATSKTLATPLADGIYYIRVRAKDAVGNYSLWGGTIMFTVDSTAPSPPSIDSSSHSLSNWNSDRTIDVSWSAADSSGISGYSYQWSTSATTVPNTTSEGINTSTVSGNRSTSQSIYFHIRAVDGAGNWSSTNHYGPFWVDANNPTGSWSYPLEGAVLSGNVNLQVNASDVGSDLKLVRFRYQPSGGTFVTISDDTTASYSTNWDTTSLTDGNYVLRARIEDNTGRYVTEDINVTVDNTPPLLTSSYTRDLDGNGKIDTIELTLNETIDQSRLASSGNDGWTVDSYTISKVDTGNGSDDTTLLLQLVEGSNPDSGNRPTISYTKQAELNSTHDMVGNQLESVSGYGTDDGAKPVVLSAETGDNNTNGKIDFIKLTFSENIDDSLLNPGTSDGWDVDGYDGESIGTGSVENDNILILSFDEGTSYDVNLTPIVMYSRLLETRSTHDLAGNQLNDYSASSTDKSAPTVPTADPVGGDYTADQSVTLTGESGAEIRYTTDGTTPTDSTGTVYSSPILIDVDTVLKAIAIDPSGNVSQVMTETYGIAPLISGETSSSATSDSVTITWTTDDPSTSRVVYDTVSHSLGAGSNYGYANSTVEDPTKVTSHSVDLTGLTAGATYYYRTVSHGSPESVSDEKTFATTTISSTTSDGGGSVAGASAPVCNEAKPGSAPILLSAVAGLNSVTLNWTKAKDPVSYYLVTFGTKSGEQLYGNPNVGDSNTTAYTINNLSGGKTYYFKVRAGNGCMPGDFSNEKSGSPSGGFIEGIPGGFASGVLGIQDQITPTGVSEGKVPPSLAPNSNTTSPRLGFFQLIWNFILGLFRK